MEELLKLVDELENENSELQMMLDNANDKISKKYDTTKDEIVGEY